MTERVHEYINQSQLYQVLIEGPLNKYDIYKTRDKTFGRKNILRNESELNLRKLGYLKSEKYLTFNPKNNLDKMSIYYSTWAKSSINDCKAHLIYVHGLDDYSARFSKHMTQYLESDYLVHLFDLPYFGYSDGVHSAIDSVDTLVLSLDSVVNEIMLNNQQNKKIFIMGISLGGLVTIKYCIRFPDKVNAINLFCPLINVANESMPSNFLVNLGKVFKFLLPRLPFLPKKKLLATLNEEAEVEFLNEPLTYGGFMRVTTGISLLEAVKSLELDAINLKTPYLIQQGECDRMVRPNGPKEFIKWTKFVEDKKVLYYKDCEHVMFEEKCAIKVFKDSIDWLDLHLE